MKNLSNEIKPKELSMGMSNDFVEASQNGATFIRVGSKILVTEINLFLFLYSY